MIKFPSIESVRHVAAHVRRNADFHGQPLPKIQYEGRVKLHGTNAGIHYNPKSGQLIAQSRERVLGVGPDDNAGFAAWVESNSEFLRLIFDLTFDDREVTVYGEWCGGNIQSTVALNQLPKMFVVFGMISHDDNFIDPEQNERGILRPYPFFIGRQPPSKLGIDGAVDELEVEHNNTLPQMYHIDLVQPAIVDMDFANPNEATARMEELTTHYETECPWAKMWGVSGVGEGLVWTPSSIYNPDENSHRLVFKTKGEKHGNKATNNKVKVSVDPEKIEDFNALVEKLLPEWRLKQGIQWMTENQIKPSKHNTGDYLKWIAKDVQKEEKDTIVASGFEEKTVMSEVQKIARRFYFANTED